MGNTEEVVVRKKGGLTLCSMAFIFSVAEESRSLCLERGVCVCVGGGGFGGVLGKEGGLRIKGEVRKGLLLESKKEPVTQERAAE